MDGGALVRWEGRVWVTCCSFPHHTCVSDMLRGKAAPQGAVSSPGPGPEAGPPSSVHRVPVSQMEGPALTTGCRPQGRALTDWERLRHGVEQAWWAQPWASCGG